MSLSRSEAEMQPSKTAETIEKVTIVGKAVVTTVLTRPSFILFYLGLAALLVGLFYGKEFPRELYLLLLVLGAIEAGCSYLRHIRPKEIKEK